MKSTDVRRNVSIVGGARGSSPRQTFGAFGRELTDRDERARVDGSDGLGHHGRPSTTIPSSTRRARAVASRRGRRSAVCRRHCAGAQAQRRRVRRHEQLAPDVVGEDRVERGAGRAQALEGRRPVVAIDTEPDRREVLAVEVAVERRAAGRLDARARQPPSSGRSFDWISTGRPAALARRRKSARLRGTRCRRPPAGSPMQSSRQFSRAIRTAV